MSAGPDVSRLWGGRFSAGPAPELDDLNRSLPVDRRLWREDITGSRAWVSALTGAGVVTSDEAGALDAGLEAVARRLGAWSEAEWAGAPDEDIHSLVERLLREEAGDVAGKLHTGRSRNDQVATDVRLWGMAAAERLDGAIRSLERALAARAAAHLDTPMPAFTHLQPAQPVAVAHWLLSHAWPLERDRERLTAAIDRAATLPLGSGAIAGCPYPVDRDALASRLGFRRVSENSMDAVADRDWIAEILFVIALLGTHLSRLAEDLIVFASPPFGFVRLSDRFATGSSLMPQKRNPDALELARARAGSAIGDLTAMLTVLKGLPSGYNKDLQEDKTLLFRAMDALGRVLPAVTGTVDTLSIDADACRAAIDPALMATDLADALVARGVPFRVAHEVVGRVLLHAEGSGRSVAELTAADLAAIAPELAGIDLAAALDPVAAMERRAGPGGTAPEAVRRQLAHLERSLSR